MFRKVQGHAENQNAGQNAGAPEGDTGPGGKARKL